jgi:transposase
VGMIDAATITRAEHDAAVAERDAKIARLEERVAKRQHALWGRRSEKQPVSPDAPFQSALFGEECVDLPPDEDDSPEPAEQQDSTTAGKKPRRKPRFREDVERKVIDIELPESERQCSCCGATMASIGYESAERAHHVPAKIVIHEERRLSYLPKSLALTKLELVEEFPLPAAGDTHCGRSGDVHTRIPRSLIGAGVEAEPERRTRGGTAARPRVRLSPRG